MATTDAPVASALVQTSNTARAGQPQRQSCDRCHKKKLRCTRDKKSNGGVCDRCLTKHTQCVYSLGLPKGRPSLHRPLTDEHTSTNTVITTSNEPVTDANVRRHSPTNSAISASFDMAHDAAYSRPALAHTHSFPTSTSVPEIVPPSVAAPLDVDLWSLPWSEPTGTERSSHEMTWVAMNLGQVNTENMLLAGNAFDANNNNNNNNAHEISDVFSPRHSPASQDSAYVSHYSHSQVGHVNHEILSNVDNNMSETISNSVQDNDTGPATAQLSKLVVHLSSLRTLSQNLSQAKDLLPSQMLNNQNLPRLDSTAFESVAAWLTHGSFSSRPQSRSRNCPNVLGDVFAATHRFIEIIQHLPIDQIVRHLVLACEALLLEIYLAILTALEHEACWSDSVGAAPLGNVRLVLVVQLCAYLIEHQHQAVDKCMSPAGGPKHYLPDGTPFSLDSVHSDHLKNAKFQVQKKLAQLRQMLGCT